MKILQLIIYLVICCFVVSGCKRNEAKHSQRCIYDHAVFSEISAKAATDEHYFSQFKQNPFFNLIWENLTFEEGELYLRKIDHEYVFLKTQFEQFRNIDQIGSPRTYHFGDAGLFSPSTLRLIAMVGEVRSKLGNFEPSHIVQIGAGCGNLCKILNDVLGFKSYTLVDLPEQLALAKKCLEKLGVNNVNFCTPEQLPRQAVYDLVISDMSFSEFNRAYQDLFFENILSRSLSGYILGHEFPKHFGVIAMNLNEIRERFEKLKSLSEWELQGTLSNRDYFIYWKKSHELGS